MTKFIINFIKLQFSTFPAFMSLAIPSMWLIYTFMGLFGKEAGLILGLLNVILLELCAALMAYYVEKKL